MATAYPTTAPAMHGEVVTVHLDLDEYSTCDSCPDLRWTGPSHAASAYLHTEATHHVTRTVRTLESRRSWVPDAAALPSGVDGHPIGTRVAAERVARPQADDGV